MKENVFFVLNDEYNAKRRADGKNSSYPDDCGAWMQGKNITKPEYFLKTQLGYQNIRREKSGLYFPLLKGKKVALSPQPTEEQILLVKRKYSTLAREEKYRKGVTGSKTNLSWKLYLLSTLGHIQLIAVASMTTPETTIHTKD